MLLKQLIDEPLALRQAYDKLCDVGFSWSVSGIIQMFDPCIPEIGRGGGGRHLVMLVNEPTLNMLHYHLVKNISN